MRVQPGSNGFSLLEFVAAMAVFIVISGAVFGMIGVAQKRYQSEQQVLDSLGNARIGMSQIELEIHNAGFPPPNTFANLPADPSTLYSTTPLPTVVREFAFAFRGFSGSPATYNQNCVINSTCTTPSGNTLSMEEDLDPYNTACPQQVEIIDYQLTADGNGTTSTLYRRVSSKDPVASATNCLPDTAASSYVPFIENIINAYQSPAVPVFSYVCNDGTTSCAPQNISQVKITLMVRASNPDLQTNQVQALTLQTIVDRISPYY